MTAPALARGRARQLLGNLFGTPGNALITAAILALALWLLPGLLRWLLLDAVFTAPNGAACRAAGTGACWAFVAEKLRFILFGYFPYDEQWRPAAAIALIVGALLLTSRPAQWQRRLVLVWLAVALVVAALMLGGFAGLSFVPTSRWGGLTLTLILASVGAAGSFPLGVLLALGRTSDLTVIRWAATGYIELVRGVPLITVLFMASVMLPLFLPDGVSVDGVIRAQIGIILFMAAYMAEVVRGGLQAVGLGQSEAAASIGMRYWTAMRRVVLPQALRVSVPPLTNTLIGLFKDTSLVAIIGLVDLVGAARQSLADPDWLGFYRESYTFTALIYFVFCFSLSRFARRLETRARGPLADAGPRW